MSLNEHDANLYLAAARGVEPIPCPGAAPERLVARIWNGAPLHYWLALFCTAGLALTVKVLS